MLLSGYYIYLTFVMICYQLFFYSLYSLVVLYSNTQELTNVDYYIHVD